MADDLQIGGMHADLGIDARGWFEGLKDARAGLADFAKEVMGQFRELEDSIRNVGIGLTAAVTLPFAGMAVVTKRGAGAFEKSMNNVHAALRGIDSSTLDQLSKAARALGPAVGRSATEAADGIETLALAGMSADAILSGGLEQTLRLAAANAAELGAAAAVVTDVMAQFGKSSGELPEVVNQVTGALDASKLSFNDFRDAIAQGGGVAGAAGVSFADFNTALAGTASLFGSGSDAGTSFKTFITTLTPKSKEAAEMMKRLGLDFYDAGGRMKSLADIADMLREKLGNLSDRSRTAVLTEIFGADAMRTAIGLMRLGGQAFDDLQNSIASTDAGEKLAIQLQGAQESTNRLAKAFDGLKIALGATGILAAFTWVTDALTSVVEWMTDLPPIVHQVAVSLWAVSAATGPMLLGLMAIGKVLAPIILLRGGFGLLGTAIAALINPVGALVAVLGQLIIRISGVSVALRALGLTMTAWAGWIGLAVAGLTLLVLWSQRSATATNAAKAAASAATNAYAKMQETTLGLVAATGQARKALIDKIKADRAAELQAMATAKANMFAARTELERAKARLAKAKSDVVVGARGDMISPKVSREIKAVEQSEAELLSRAKTLQKLADTVQGYNNAINTPAYGTVDLNLETADKGGKGAKASGPDAQELADRREMMALEQQMAVARVRDDKDEMRRIQDQIDLRRRIADYEDAGLDRALATVAAAKDLKDIKTAEAEYDARQIEQAEDALDLQLAQIRGDAVMVRHMEDRAWLEERVTFWQEKGLTLLEAQKRAAEDLVHIDIARAEAAAKAAQQDALDREAELSRLRGDTDAQQRAKQRVAEINRRTARYVADGDGKVNEDVARDRATQEVDEEERMRQQGQWRDTFKGAIRAAMDGDLKGFVKNWWKDQVSRGLEEALNSLSDMLFNLFRQAMGQGGAAGGGGGGLFGSLLGGLGGLGSIFLPGGGKSLDVLPKISGGIPKFATGGSFEIGGRPGIDTNLVQFWGTAGETVNIRRPGNDNGRGGDTYVFSGNLMTPEFFAMIDAKDMAASSRAVGITERRSAQRAKRRLGRR